MNVILSTKWKIKLLLESVNVRSGLVLTSTY